jgi:phage baseplate assembly protein V
MALNTGRVSFKVGVVHEATPGFARVAFADLDGLVSAWLPVLMRKTLKDKECFTPDVGEHVACVLDENFDDGVVLGAMFSDADAPPITSSDKFRFQFFDGGSFEYDRSSGTLAIVTTGPVNVTAGGPVTVTAPSVTLNTATTTCTGDLIVQQKLTYLGGLAGSGGAAVIDGGLQVTGDVSATGTIIDVGGNSNHHSH